MARIEGRQRAVTWRRVQGDGAEGTWRGVRRWPRSAYRCAEGRVHTAAGAGRRRSGEMEAARDDGEGRQVWVRRHRSGGARQRGGGRGCGRGAGPTYQHGDGCAEKAQRRGKCGTKQACSRGVWVTEASAGSSTPACEAGGGAGMSDSCVKRIQALGGSSPATTGRRTGSCRAGQRAAGSGQRARKERHRGCGGRQRVRRARTASAKEARWVRRRERSGVRDF
ncbi:hypothetical protein DFH08DRAFT_824112 [Mycena albidolilacea]|uniref:Uncharacterized protein n=1 Tax=Mycena albidolilacea TaxID=1033008 RepID=A0AAD6Z4V4_9AGAR|nr:hypothetical protein DFH08DRAFT_824112 [Mycena albidolilacea]